MTAITNSSSANTVGWRRLPPETVLLAAVLVLVAFGILMVFDTSFPISIYSHNVHSDHNPYQFGRTQAKGLMFGLAAMACVIGVGYSWLRAYAGTFMVGGLVMLCLVWAPKIGHSELHAARWIKYGIQFQPSEIAKLALIIFVANMMARSDFDARDFMRGIVAPFAAAGAYMMLIFMEPDLGTTIVVFVTFLTMLFVGGAKSKHVLMVCLLAPALIFLRGGLKPGQMERIHIFTEQGSNPRGAGFQTYHSRLAIGSGEILGVGWGMGREKYQLPEANSDFIFATVGEELGLLGSTLVLCVFGVVSCCGVAIARKTTDPFGRYLAAGITALLTWQTLINVAVVTISIPATGVPLPFISFGSTSLILSLVCVGLLVSVAQNPHGARGAARY